MDMEIYKKLRFAFFEALKDGYSPICSILHGSQNYNLQTENSDVDIYVLVLPKVENFIHGRLLKMKKASGKDQIVYKDIREYMQECLKQSPTMLETLFTPYRYFNDNGKQKRFYDYIIANREAIANSDLRAQFYCANGIAYSYKKQILKILEKENPSPEETETALKKMAGLYWIKDFIMKRIEGADFLFSIVEQEEDAAILRKIKTYSFEEPLDKEKFKSEVELVMKEIEIAGKDFVQYYDFPDEKANREQAEAVFEKWIIEEFQELFNVI